MSPSETDAARDQSITQVLQARTSAEIAEATETLDRWLQEHPNDTGMADGYEQLSMMQDGTEGQQAQCRPTVVGPQMTALDEARERLCDQVFAAKSLAEVTAAQEALRQWMRDHPDEPGMADGFEVLSHREDFARDREAQRQPATEESAEMSVVAREQRKPPKYSGMRG